MGEGIAPSKLSEIFNAAPKEVQDWINAPENDEIKRAMYAMAKRSDRAREVLDVIPNKKTADNVLKVYDKFHDFDTGFNGIQSIEDATSYWQKMYQDFAVPGPDGKPKANPAFAHIERALVDSNMDYLIERSQRDGKLHPVLGDIFNRAMDVVQKAAEQSKNQDLLLAIEAFREANPAAASQPKDEPTPEQQRREADLRQREDADRARSAKQRADDATRFLDTANKEAAGSAADQFLPVLEKSNLSPFEQKSAVEEIGNRLQAKLNKSQVYKREYAALKAALDKNPSEQGQQALQELMIEYQNNWLGPIITEVIRDVSAGRVQRSGATEDKIAQQREASKPEPVGAGTAPAAPAQLTEAQWEAEDRKAWEASDKRVDFLTFTMDRALKRANQA